MSKYVHSIASPPVLEAECLGTHPVPQVLLNPTSYDPTPFLARRPGKDQRRCFQHRAVLCIQRRPYLNRTHKQTQKANAPSALENHAGNPKTLSNIAAWPTSINWIKTMLSCRCLAQLLSVCSWASAASGTVGSGVQIPGFWLSHRGKLELPGRLVKDPERLYRHELPSISLPSPPLQRGPSLLQANGLAFSFQQVHMV